MEIETLVIIFFEEKSIKVQFYILLYYLCRRTDARQVLQLRGKKQRKKKVRETVKEREREGKHRK